MQQTRVAQGHGAGGQCGDHGVERVVGSAAEIRVGAEVEPRRRVEESVGQRCEGGGVVPGLVAEVWQPPSGEEAAGYTSTTTPPPARSTGMPWPASAARSPAQRIAVCEIRSAATLRGRSPVSARTRWSVTRYARARRHCRPVTPCGTATFPLWWAVMKATKAAGQPNGQSIPTLSACVTASTIVLSVVSRWTSRTVAEPDDQSIRARAVFFGSAARSTPIVIIRSGYAARCPGPSEECW